MEELYAAIEDKIRQAGYDKMVDGKTFYQDISKEAEEKEEGTYMFLIKKDENITYEGTMTIMEEQFDLHYVDIIDGEKTYHVDFDA